MPSRATMPTIARARPEARPGSRSAAREDAILDAAAALVVEVGYDRVTVDAIAARAHASKSTMYRIWPGKAELVADALRRRADIRSGTLPDTGGVRGDLLAIVRALGLSLRSDTAGPSLLGLAEPMRSDPVLRDVVGGQIQERTRHDASVLCARAAERGGAVDPDRAAELIGLAMAQLVLRTLLDGEPPGDAAQRAFVDRIVLPLLDLPTTTSAVHTRHRRNS